MLIQFDFSLIIHSSKTFISPHSKIHKSYPIVSNIIDDDVCSITSTPVVLIC